MQEIHFVTSNRGKVASLGQLLDPARYRLLQADIDVPEIQSSTALEVAIFKAQFAYKKLRKSVVVQDSAFHINALRGFPGPYIKYINETVGVEGLLELMRNKDDRSAYFEQALVYATVDGKLHSFTSTIEQGTVSQRAYARNYEYSWSDLWRIYIPKAATTTLAQLFVEGEDKPVRSWANDKSEIAQFVKWLAVQP